MLIHWNVSPEIFEYGPLRIRWYGLMFLIGFSLGFQVMKKVCQWEGKPIEKLDSLLVHLVLGTTIGARLGHCLFYDFDYYMSHPIDIFKIWEGGLASHGGVMGVIFALWLFVRKNPEFNWMWSADRLSVLTVMTGIFIRLGNLMNSEILGRPTDGTWGVIFERVDQIPRHPAQLYESVCYLLITILTANIYLRKKAETPSGLLFGVVIALVFSCRFVIEWFKENQSDFERDMVINMGQLLSLPFILVGGYCIMQALRRDKK